MDPDSKRVTIGIKLFQMGMSFLNNGIIGEQIKYILAKTAEKHPMAIGFAVTDHKSIAKGQVYSVYELSTMTQINFVYETGLLYPVNDGVYGRILMAYHEPREEIETIIRSIPLEHRSKYSTTDPDLLLEEYGKVIGCVGAAILRTDWSPERERQVIGIVRECARDMSLLFPANSGIL